MTNDAETSPADLKTAYRIILTLVDTLSASSDLIAKMAELMGEDAVRPLQHDAAWLKYLESKRRLEGVHGDMHRFAEAASALIEAENALLDSGAENGAPADE